MSKKYRPILRKGTHLADSKDTLGAKRGTLLDDETNQIVGQAEWEEIDDEDEADDEEDEIDDDIYLGDSPPSGFLGKLAVTAAVIGVTAFATSNANRRREEELEHQRELERQQIREEKKQRRNAAIKKYVKFALICMCKGIWTVVKYLGLAVGWCLKNVFLGIKAFCIWLFRVVKQAIERRKAYKREIIPASNSYTSLTNHLMSPQNFSILADEAFQQFQQNLTSEEAQIHLLKIILLANELASEIRRLSHTGVFSTPELSAEYLQWQKNMEKLTTMQTVNFINYILANHRGNLDSEMMASLVANFYNGTHDNYNYDFVPISQENIQRALKLY